LRALLEADTLFHAVDLMTEETFARAQAILAQFDLALESGTQIEHWAELNTVFTPPSTRPPIAPRHWN
jgi:DNA-binding GntR family transcriptional regulator